MKSLILVSFVMALSFVAHAQTPTSENYTQLSQALANLMGAILDSGNVELANSHVKSSFNDLGYECSYLNFVPLASRTNVFTHLAYCSKDNKFHFFISEFRVNESPNVARPLRTDGLSFNLGSIVKGFASRETYNDRTTGSDQTSGQMQSEAQRLAVFRCSVLSTSSGRIARLTTLIANETQEVQKARYIVEKADLELAVNECNERLDRIRTELGGPIVAYTPVDRLRSFYISNPPRMVYP